ncbi:TPA: hypothetical protein DIC38_01550 [Candidatus Nomurabacteria bacterium]|nr:MAG: hypothetical protein O210_OD1C00001G0421 [Parcubacteria bacterium RAAC4_OD1_1]HCY26346.1 hypothetical protein [Candidatus Nomurabacteria bacterium]
MDAILFFGCFFEVDSYKSIECKSAQEIKTKLTENENIKFLVIPEEESNLIEFSDHKIKPVVIFITKNYKSYQDRKFNKILASKETAKIMIERWQ